MPTEETLLQSLQQLRKDLHQYPEVSGEEHKTARKIKSFVAQYEPDQVIDGLGGEGIIFVFEGERDGPTIMIRAELDALAIDEINDIPYRSRTEGKGHLCGHDGHMAMVAGVAAKLSANRPLSGRVALIFQPAEETGEGAARMLAERKFNDIAPDYIFALHNLPGFKKGEIIVRNGIFSSASKGMIIKFTGKTSHAAEPENGVSPALAVAKAIETIEQMPLHLSELKDFTLATVVHTRLGERTFGVTPGSGVVMATLRAYRDDDLSKLEEAINKKVVQIAGQFGLQVQFEETENFSSTINDDNCCGYVKEAARQLGLSVTVVDRPFRWSEDFGLFTQRFNGALFGLGSGENTPDLHNPDYDFPEDIMGTGVLMFYGIIDQLLNKKNA